MMQLKRFAMCCSVFVIVGLSLMVTSGYSADFADLVFYFPLDEGSGDKITDISPNKLVAKLENKPKWVQGKVKGGVAFTDGKSMGASVPEIKY